MKYAREPKADAFQVGFEARRGVALRGVDSFARAPSGDKNIRSLRYHSWCLHHGKESE